MKRFLVALILITLLCLPVFANETFAPQISEKDVIELIEQFGVQVRIPVEMVYRSLTFYKYEEGSKLTPKEFDRLNEDEQLWYEQGYIVKYGEWIGDDKDEKDKIIKTAIYGSGSIIYSQILPEALQSKSMGFVTEGMYAQTLIMTNYHVVQPLVDKLSLGSKVFPINVYEPIDIITQADPPSAKIRQGARPTQQKYIYLVDKEEQSYIWKATTNTAGIKVKVDQNFDIEGTCVGYDKGLDVGIISIRNVAFQPYATFRDISCQVGEKVWIIHAPLAMRFSVDRGHVNQVGLDLGVDPDGLGWNDQVKLDIPSAPGSSGSGIFDENGFLIALFHGGLIHKLGQGYSYIEGGHLAHEGVSVAEWLNWKGFSYIFDVDKLYKDQQKLLDKKKQCKNGICPPPRD